MTHDASSRVLTEPDPLTTSTLHPMQVLATRQTLRHLVGTDIEPWALSHGPLTVMSETNVYALVPVQSSPQDRYSHRKSLTLDVAAVVPAGQFVQPGVDGQFVIIAVVIPADSATYFVRVAQNGNGKRHVQGVSIFAPPALIPKHWMRTSAVPPAYTIQQRSSIAAPFPGAFPRAPTLAGRLKLDIDL
jgi:hypothetical protein